MTDWFKCLLLVPLVWVLARGLPTWLQNGAECKVDTLKEHAAFILDADAEEWIANARRVDLLQTSLTLFPKEGSSNASEVDAKISVLQDRWASFYNFVGTKLAPRLSALAVAQASKVESMWRFQLCICIGWRALVCIWVFCSVSMFYLVNYLKWAMKKDLMRLHNLDDLKHHHEHGNLIGHLVELAIEHLDQKLLGVNVDFGSLVVRPQRGIVEIKSLTIENSSGYWSDYMFHAEQVVIDVDVLAYSLSFAQRVVIEKIELKGVDFIWEKGFMTSNVKDILNHLHDRNHTHEEVDTDTATEYEDEGELDDDEPGSTRHQKSFMEWSGMASPPEEGDGADSDKEAAGPKSTPLEAQNPGRLRRLSQKLARSMPRPSTPSSSNDAKKKHKAGKEVVVQQLTCQDINFKFAFHALAGCGIRLAVEDIHYENFHDQAGITHTGEIIQLLLSSLMKSVLVNVIGKDATSGVFNNACGMMAPITNIVQYLASCGRRRHKEHPHHDFQKTSKKRRRKKPHSSTHISIPRSRSSLFSGSDGTSSTQHPSGSRGGHKMMNWLGRTRARECDGSDGGEHQQFEEGDPPEATLIHGSRTCEPQTAANAS